MVQTTKTLTTTAAAVALTFGMGAASAGDLNHGNAYVSSDVPAIFGDANLNEAVPLNETQMEATQGTARYSNPNPRHNSRYSPNRKYGVSNRYGQHKKPRNWRGSHPRYKR